MGFGLCLGINYLIFSRLIRCSRTWNCLCLCLTSNIDSLEWCFVMQFHAGKNVGIGKDHTIFSLIDGLVKFEKFGPDRKKVSQWSCPLDVLIFFGFKNGNVFCLQISVYPREIVPENPNSYRARKREAFRVQREKKKARRENYTYTLPTPELVLASAAVDDEETNADCWESNVKLSLSSL